MLEHNQLPPPLPPPEGGPPPLAEVSTNQEFHAGVVVGQIQTAPEPRQNEGKVLFEVTGRRQA